MKQVCEQPCYPACWHCAAIGLSRLGGSHTGEPSCGVDGLMAVFSEGFKRRSILISAIDGFMSSWQLAWLSALHVPQLQLKLP